MHLSRPCSWRRLCRGLLAALVMVALGGCYPYYYDLQYTHSDGYYKRDYHPHTKWEYKRRHGEKRYYHRGSRYHHRDGYPGRKRHRHHREWW